MGRFRRCVELPYVASLCSTGLGPLFRVPPRGILGPDRGQLGLGIDESVASLHRQLILTAHGNGIYRADLRAEPAEEAAARSQDELAQLPIAFFRRDDIHLQAGRRADASTEPAGDAECLTRFRIRA